MMQMSVRSAPSLKNSDLHSNREGRTPIISSQRAILARRIHNAWDYRTGWHGGTVARCGVLRDFRSDLAGVGVSLVTGLVGAVARLSRSCGLQAAGDAAEEHGFGAASGEGDAHAS